MFNQNTPAKLQCHSSWTIRIQTQCNDAPALRASEGGRFVMESSFPLPISMRVRHQRSVSNRCAMHTMVVSTNFSSSTR